MKKRNNLLGVAAALLLTIGLVGCSSARMDTSVENQSKESHFTASYDNGIYEEAAVEDSAATSEIMPESEAPSDMETGTGATNPAVMDNRKLIRNISLSMETTEFDDLIKAVNSQVNTFGGYIQESNFNGNYYNNLRSQHLIIRVPVKQLDQFIMSISEQGNVLSKSETTEDITLQYVDMESHKKSLKIEQERLFELLEKADKLEDIIALEQRLSQVRYELEYYESQLRTYDNLVDYSTVYLDITEVKRETNVNDITIWERMKSGFERNIYNLKLSLEDFSVWFVASIPVFIFGIIILGILIILFKYVILRLIKNSKKMNSRVKKDHKSTSSQIDDQNSVDNSDSIVYNKENDLESKKEKD